MTNWVQLRPWNGYFMVTHNIPMVRNQTTIQSPLHYKVYRKFFQTPEIFASVPIFNCYQKRKFNMALRTWPSRGHVHPRSSTIGEKLKHGHYDHTWGSSSLTAIGSTLTYCSEGGTLSRVDRLHIAPANSWCIQMKVEIKIRTIILNDFNLQIPKNT
jgi:hypothetical protein